MDDEALGSDRAGPRRWVDPLVAVAACLAVVAVAILVANRSGWQTAAPEGVPGGAVRVTGNGMLIQVPDGDLTMCAGGVLQSMPPQCPSTVPVTGITWDDVPHAESQSGTTWADVTITGWWGDGLLTVTQVSGPPAPQEGLDNAFEPLCADPEVAEGGSEMIALGDMPGQQAFERLPGFQGVWVTYPDGSPGEGSDTVKIVHNVAVQGDVEQATASIRRFYDGLLCVGTIPGPTRAELMSAVEVLKSQDDEVGALSFGPSLTGGKAALFVTVFVATEDAVARIHQAVGPEIAEFTEVYGQLEQI